MVRAAVAKGFLRDVGRALLARRHVSTGKRDFYQRINEQHLAHELQNIAAAAHGAKTPDVGLFDPQIRTKPTRRVLPSARLGGLGDVENAADHEVAGAGDTGSAGGRGSSGAGMGLERRRTKPWLHYESLRGTSYPSGGTGPKWQDLTHSEAQRLQEMYMRKKMLDRKVLWLKMQDLPNPQKEAKFTLRRQQRAEEEAKAVGDGGDMYPTPFLDTPPGSRKLQKMEEAARLEELESRFRMRIREQKLENARIQKATVPSIGGVIMDPIQRHVRKRLLRQRAKIYVGLEENLNRNTAQILYEHLRGVAVSIVRVQAKRPRQTQEIHYNLTSDHDPAWVQKQLDILAPKLRSQLALKVNMGMTPNIRFVPHTSAKEIRRKYLWQFAKEIQEQVPVGGDFGTTAGIG